ncbi:MAG: zinc ribbon domain-containing protein [Clostridia bacterium]|nr:zinc ribbon domain-containing protein [Clostridia bacterium]
MFCPMCGNKIEDGSLFCPQCGAKIGQQAQQAQQTVNEAVNNAEQTVDNAADQAARYNPVPQQEQFSQTPPQQPQQPQYGYAPQQPQQSQQPQYGYAPQQPQQPQYGYAPQPQYYGAPKKSKLPVILALVGVALVAVAVVLIVVLAGGGGGSGSAVKCAENYIKADNTRDPSAMLDAMPDYLIYTAGRSYGLDEDCTRGDVLKAYNDQLDAIKEASPEMYEKYMEYTKRSVSFVSSETTEELKSGEPDFDSMRTRYINSLPAFAVNKCDPEKITEFATVKVTYTIDGGSEQTETIDCVKYNGSWYVADA